MFLKTSSLVLIFSIISIPVHSQDYGVLTKQEFIDLKFGDILKKEFKPEGNLYVFENCKDLTDDYEYFKKICNGYLNHIEVSTSEKFHNILQKLIIKDKEIIKKLLNLIPEDLDLEKTILEIFSIGNPAPIVFNPITYEIDFSEKPTTQKSRLGYISEIKIQKDLDSNNLVNYFSNLSFVKVNDLNVQKINNNLFYIYNKGATKDIIINEGYWEKIRMLIAIDNDILTLMIEGEYAAGLTKPFDYEYEISNGRFYEKFNTFFIDIKNEILRL